MLPKIFVLLMCTYLKLTASKFDDLYSNAKVAYTFPFVSRNEWSAKSPKQVEHFKLPIPYIMIHQTNTPQCGDKACCFVMAWLQMYHMEFLGLSDIEYNFAVASDGTVYEGRGWRTLGPYNNNSLGIALIGYWSDDELPQQQINSVKALLKTAVDLGYVKPDYSLVGHRDMMDTICPGDALYKEIQTWEHYLPSYGKDQ